MALPKISGANIVIEFVEDFFFFPSLIHKAILYSYNDCGLFLMVRYNFILPGSGCISISGTHVRKLNAVQAQFYVSCAVAAQDNQGGQFSVWLVTSRAHAVK